MKKDLHVLHVIGTPTLRPFGGTPAKLLYQIKYSPPGLRFTVCCIEDEGELAGEFRNLGCEVVALESYHNYDVRAILRIYRLLRSLPIDIVHVHFARASIYGRIAARLAGLPCVVSDHGILANMNWLVVLTDNLLNLITTSRVANSRATAAAVRRRVRLRRSNIHVIYNGVPDLPEAQPETAKRLRDSWSVADEDFLIVNVGSHIPMRDHTCLLRAIGRLPENVRARVVLIGDGPSHDGIVRSIASMGLENVVSVAGQLGRDEVHQALLMADVFVNPARLEAFGIATVEAMLARLPVLCAEGGSLPELLPKSLTAVMFAPGDDHALAELLLRLHGDRQLCRTLGAEGRSHAVAEFPVDRFAEKFGQLYQECVAGERD